MSSRLSSQMSLMNPQLPADEVAGMRALNAMRIMCGRFYAAPLRPVDTVKEARDGWDGHWHGDV